jgi:hypothetical protein
VLGLGLTALKGTLAASGCSLAAFMCCLNLSAAWLLGVVHQVCWRGWVLPWHHGASVAPIPAPRCLAVCR